MITRAEIWKTLFERQTQSPVYRDNVCGLVLGNNDIMFSKHEPNMRDIWIADWELAPIDGKQDSDTFWEGIKLGVFPVNQYLRNEEELEYLPLRDFWHDTFGHLGILHDFQYTDYLRTLAYAWWVASKMRQSDNERTQFRGEFIQHIIDQVYWFTAEFGAVKEDGKPKAYGAGIVSSINELEYFASDKATHFPVNEHNVRQFILTERKPEYEQFQTAYYVLDSFKMLPFIAREVLSLF